MSNAYRTIPDELFDIMKRKNIKYKSPYSCSYYNNSDKTWEYTKPNTIRVANHWNFESQGELHCRIDEQIANKYDWIMAKYDKASKTYKFMQGFMNAETKPKHVIKSDFEKCKRMLKNHLLNIKNLKLLLSKKDYKGLKTHFGCEYFGARKYKEVLNTFSKGLFAITTCEVSGKKSISCASYNEYHDKFGYTGLFGEEEYKRMPKYLRKEVDKLIS